MAPPTPPPTAPVENPARGATIRLLFFGPVRTQTGIDQDELESPKEISSSTLWSLLLEKHPALLTLRSTIRIARNGEFLREDETIRPGDEIALIPPVSGG
jgi:molybdopterin converting factor subunit 1